MIALIVFVLLFAGFVALACWAGRGEPNRSEAGTQARNSTPWGP